MLSNNKAVHMSPVQLHCIGRRMTLPIASSGRQIILYMSLHVQSFSHVHVCRALMYMLQC